MKSAETNVLSVIFIQTTWVSVTSIISYINYLRIIVCNFRKQERWEIYFLIRDVSQTYCFWNVASKV